MCRRFLFSMRGFLERFSVVLWGLVELVVSVMGVRGLWRRGVFMGADFFDFLARGMLLGHSL